MTFEAITRAIRPMFGYHPDPKIGERSLATFQRSSIPIVNPSLTTLQFLAETGLSKLMVDQARMAANACAGSLHLDLFDDSYVNTGNKGSNLEIMSPKLVKQIVRNAGVPLDAHFMVRPSTIGSECAFRSYIGEFIGAGASFISVHYGAFLQDSEEKALPDFFGFVRDRGAKVGLAINPDESAECLFRFEDKIDFALVMSVIPGAGGRGFDERSITNLEDLRVHAFQPLIAVDGSIGPKTIGMVTEAGGKWDVVGSAWFGSPKSVEELRTQTQMFEVYEALRKEWSRFWVKR